MCGNRFHVLTAYHREMISCLNCLNEEMCLTTEYVAWIFSFGFSCAHVFMTLQNLWNCLEPIACFPLCSHRADPMILKRVMNMNKLCWAWGKASNGPCAPSLLWWKTGIITSASSEGSLQLIFRKCFEISKLKKKQCNCQLFKYLLSNKKQKQQNKAKQKQKTILKTFCYLDYFKPSFLKVTWKKDNLQA